MAFKLYGKLSLKKCFFSYVIISYSRKEFRKMYIHKFSKLKIFRGKSCGAKKRNVKINYIHKADIKWKRGKQADSRGTKFRAAKILARIVGVCSRSALKYILRHRIITSVPRLCKCLIAKEPANGKKLQRWRQIKSHPRRFEPAEAESRCSRPKNSHTFP